MISPSRRKASTSCSSVMPAEQHESGPGQGHPLQRSDEEMEKKGLLAKGHSAREWHSKDKDWPSLCPTYDSVT